MPVPMMAPTPSMTSCDGPQHALKSAAATGAAELFLRDLFDGFGREDGHAPALSAGARGVLNQVSNASKKTLSCS